MAHHAGQSSTGVTFPLSLSQQRLWYFTQLEPDSRAYNIGAFTWLDGPLKVDLLERSINDIRIAHGSWRLGFLDDEHLGPRQFVRPALDQPIDVHIVDADKLNGGDIDEYVRELAREYNNIDFDLTQDAPVRYRLVRVSEQRHALLLTMHHIVSDATTLQVCMPELMLRYYSYVQGKPMKVDGDDSDYYVKYAQDNREWIESAEVKQQLEKWQQTFANEPNYEPFDIGRRDTSKDSTAYGVESRHLIVNHERIAVLQGIAKNLGTSLFVVLLSALHITLAKLSGQNVIRIGVPAANRSSKYKQAQGFFVNNLPMQMHLDSQYTVETFIQAVSARLSAMREYEGLPYEQIKGLVQQNQPMFQMAFNYRRFGAGVSLKLGDITIVPEEIPVAEIPFELVFDVVNLGKGSDLSIKVSYASAMYGSETIDTLADSFDTALNVIANNNQQQHLSEFTCLSDNQRQRLNELSYSPAIWNKSVLFPDIIKQHSLTQPDAVALVHGLGAAQQCVTYHELEARSNQLAHHLIQHYRIEPDQVIGVSLERGVDMIIAFLGVMKAGAAFLPLDPDYPTERLSYMLSDSGAPILLTQSRLLNTFESDSLTQVALDTLDVSQQPTSPVSITLHPDQLAYVIYTSGSTGQPKGVVVSHHSLSMHAQTIGERYDMNVDDVELLFASISFDGCIERWTTPLVFGGKVIIREQTMWSVETTCQVLEEERITRAFFPPSYANALMDWIEHSQPKLNLTSIGIGGEAFTQELYDRVQNSSLGHQFLINGYGPTETVVTPLLWKATRDTQINSAYAPIGHAVGERRLYVLDQDLNPVPEGIAGELYIGCEESLARGYHNRPDLTAERFLPDPFTDKAGERMYRTGDRVQWTTLSNGDTVMDYLGRDDQQVKIRGFRVELGEIESKLHAQPQIQEVAVITQDVPGGKRLVAYCVPSDDIQPEDIDNDYKAQFKQQLNAQLKDELPDYMQPSHYELMSQLPLNPAGKIDRKHLPEIDWQQDSSDYQAPEGEQEELLASIWAELLQVEKVGREDNFFALGGDSIIALQAISKLKQQGWSISPKDLFDKPSMAELAGAMQPSQQILADQSAIQGVLTKSARLTAIQQRFLHNSGNQPCNQYLLLDVDELDRQGLNQALIALINHHDVLRARYKQEDGKTRIEYLPLLDDHTQLLQQPPLTESDRATLNDEQQQQWLASLHDQIDIETGPILQAAYWVNDNQPRLFLSIHHMVVDGVSWRVLLEDLLLAYQQVQHQQTITLPAKTHAVHEWAHYLRDNIETWAMDQLDYWQQLESFNTPLFASSNVEDGDDTARPDVIKKSHRIAADTFGEWQGALDQYANVTLEESLLMSLSLALSEQANQSKMCIHRESHGRFGELSEMDLSRSMGWFTSLYPQMLDVPKTTAEQIKSLKEQLRSASNGGLAYGYLEQSGDLPRSEAPQVLFNYLGRLIAAPNMTLVDSGLWTRGDSLDADLVLNIIQDNQGLLFELSANAHVMSEAGVQSLVQAMMDQWSRLAEFAQQHPPVLTPCDVPLADISQANLDAIHAQHQGDIENLLPLSPLQQGLLFQCQLSDDRSAYVNQITLPVKYCDIERFKQAWQKLMERHDMLRANVLSAAQTDEPYLLIHKHLPLPWYEHTIKNNEDEIKRYRNDLIAQGFDLYAPPLWRVDALKIGHDTYHIVFTMHHILMDGWSNGVLMTDLLALYQGQTLVPLGHGYADYLLWLKQQSDERAQAYWQEKLAHLQSPSRIVTSNQNIAINSDHYRRHVQHFSQAETEHMHNVIRQKGLTLNSVLQAIWLLLLAQRTGQSHNAVGVTVAGRPTELAGHESMLGLFINTLPLCVETSANTPVIDWISAIQNDNIDMQQYAHCQLGDIQQWAGFSAESLFDTLIVFENYPLDQNLLNRPEQTLEFGEPDSYEFTHYPLTLAILPSAELDIVWAYDSARLSPDSIGELSDQYRHLLNQVLSVLEHNTNATLASLNRLTDSQNQRLHDLAYQKITWNKSALIPELIQKQAHAQPDAIALVHGLGDAQQCLTYAELEAHSNQLAHYLTQHHSIEPDQIIGVSLERGVNMIIAFLGVMKAGAAFLPLDPDYPNERLSYMLSDSGADLLLTQQSLLDTLLTDKLTQIALDELDISQQSSEPVPVALHPDQLAYVIYTSGSTGKPKGVVVSHHSLSMHAQTIGERYDMNVDDVELLFASISFDGCIERWTTPLIFGGKIIIREQTMWSVETTCQVLEEERITRAFFPPSYANALMDWIEHSQPKLNLTSIGIGGEAFTQELYDRVQNSSLKHQFLINGYGPTETVVTPLLWKATRDTHINSAYAPIGHAVGERRLYVLDQDLNPVPEGIAGELYIGCEESLARGYHNRPDLTAERFLPDPFTDKAGERMYRTGDRVQWTTLSNGDTVMDYLGRDDQQVKIRGYRIELGEIESKLHAQPQIQEVAVITQDAPGGKRLVAYCVPSDDIQPEDIDNDYKAQFKHQLNAQLQDELPDYMQPSHYELMSQLPLNPAGKIDRKHLPEIDWQQDSSDYQAPEGEQEELLASIWAELLQVEKVGREDNFFDLGGHSILATKMVSRLRQEQGVVLPLKHIFAQPQLKQLALLIGAQKNQQQQQQRLQECIIQALADTGLLTDELQNESQLSVITHYLLQLTPDQRQSVASVLATQTDIDLTALPLPSIAQNQDVPLAPVQQRLWTIYRIEPANTAYNIAGCFKVNSVIDAQRFERALLALTQRHHILRTRLLEYQLEQNNASSPQILTTSGVQTVQHLDEHAQVALQRINGQQLTQRDIDQAISQHANQPFELSSDYPWRILLIEQAQGCYIQIVMHHIASDAWSIDLLMQELMQAYVNPNSLGQLEYQYRDYAAWHQLVLDLGERQRQLDYWRNALSDQQPERLVEHDIDVDGLLPRTAAQFEFSLSDELSAGLTELARALNVTTANLILAAWQWALASISARDDISVGLPMANREQSETQAMIGFFVNTLVIRTRPFAHVSVNDWIQQVHQRVIEAQAQQTLPFNQLVEALAPKRALGDTPLFQVSYNYLQALQNVSGDNAPADFADITPVHPPRRFALYDMTLQVTEEPTQGIFSATIGYAANRFHAATAERLANRLTLSLQQFVCQPQANLAALDTLSEAQYKHWQAFSQAHTPAPSAFIPLAHSIVKRCQQQPDAIALQHISHTQGTVQLTYGELDRYSAVVALHLNKLGVGPEDLVAVQLPRGVHLMATLVAVLRSGAAFVPIDPDYPASRRHLMITQSKASYCISDNSQDLPDNVARIALDTLLTDVDGNAIDAQALDSVSLMPEHLAYIIYTSGSTGTPKGVACTQGALSMHIDAISQRYQLTKDDSEILFGSVSFDGSIGRWASLLSAGAKVIVRDQQLWSAEQTCEVLQQHHVTLACFPPSYLSALLDTIERTQPDLNIRLWSFGGEAVTRELYQKLKASSPNSTYLNLYGPTEATITPTSYLDKGEGFDSEYMPIGQANGHRCLYVLDAQLNPVAHGQIGELYIGVDASLARGYIHRPDLTAERFLPNPFSGEHGERMYRTGDLVSVSNDQLIFHGRKDQQVKIRGHRIEMGEIETRLQAFSFVQQACVVASSNNSLVACVVLNESALADDREAVIRQLHDGLNAQLPQYMCPDQYQVLEQLPLTPAGKVDRRALASVQQKQLDARPYQAPQTETEQWLAEQWQTLLGVNKVSRQDNFFELGGHSLLATRLISHIHAYYELSLPLAEIFNRPQLHDIAERLEKQRRQHTRLDHNDLQAMSEVLSSLSLPLDKLHGHNLNAQKQQLAHALLGANDEQLQQLADSPLPFGRLPLARSGDQPHQAVSLAPIQKRMWALYQLEPDNPAYNIAGRLRINGELDQARLERALYQLTVRHSVLRMRINDDSGHALQYEADAQLDFVVESYTQDANDKLTAHATQTFVLQQQPPMRALLLVDASQQQSPSYVLQIVLHHIACDAWSIDQIQQDLITAYVTDAPLPPLTVRYTDYAAWQHRQLMLGERQHQLDYWSNALGQGQPERLIEHTLHCDPLAPRSASNVQLTFPASQGQRLANVCDDHGVSLASAVMAAWQLALAYISGQRDIRVGMPVANRPILELEDMVGFFINTLVIRNQVQPSAHLASWLKQVQQSMLDAAEHQSLPFDEIVEALARKRQLGDTPLFQVLFNYLPKRPAHMNMGNLSISAQSATQDYALFDLALDVREHSDKALELNLGYADNRFSASSMQTLLDSLLRVLDRFAEADASTKLAQLELLSGDQQSRLDTLSYHPSTWNKSVLFPDIIKQHSLTQPDAVALVHGLGEAQQRVTYAELEARSNQLAHYLLSQHNIQPEQIIGISLERSVDMIIAFLGVMKSGAAFLPMDPDYPSERLSYMLSDSGAPLLITQSSLLNTLDADKLTQIALDELDVSQQPSHPVDITLHPDQLAYVIYTSGSTGQPKGVVVSHGNYSMHVQTIGERYGLSKDDIELQFSSISFDGCVERWGSPLAFGGKVVIRDQVLWSAETLCNVMEKEQATRVFLPPSYAAAFIDWVDYAQPKLNLTSIGIGGEAFTQELYDRVQNSSLGHQFLINGYGPTETVVTPLLWKATRDTQINSAYAPIGHAVGERRLYVLDQDLNPVPEGIAGELYIGCEESLARGYHNRPDLTAERFLPDPFTDKSGERMYRTGDRVQWSTLSNGDTVMDYLGRDDQQVKIRGFRVELGEIESKLHAQPQIQEVAVITQDAPGGKRLVAYCVPSDDIQPEGIDSDYKAQFKHQLNAQLKDELPDYMQPSHYELMSQLPLNPAGKIDRKHLPEIDWQQDSSDYQAPEGEQEELLASIWAELLQVEKVGREDNFFALGGDSIIALQAISKLKQQGWSISPKDLFDKPSMAELAAAMQKGAMVDASQSEIHIDQRFDLMPIQQHYFSMPNNQPSHFNQHTYLKLNDDLNVPAFKQALQFIYQQHPQLGLHFEQGEHGWQQYYTDAEYRPETFWARDAANESQAEDYCQQAQQSLDIQQGQLLRVVHLTLPSEQRLLLVVHHLVIDGVSWRILLEDLWQAYLAYSKNVDAQILYRSASMQTVVQHVSDWSQQHTAQSRQDFWNQQLNLQRHAESSTEPAQYQDRKTVELTFDKQQTQQLLSHHSLAESGQSLPALLLTTLVHSLKSAGDDLLLFMESHGRDDNVFNGIDLSRTIGWMTSMYPLRITHQKTITASLDGVLDCMHQASQDSGISFGSQCYNDPDLWKKTQQVELIFNYLGQYQAQAVEQWFSPIQGGGAPQSPEQTLAAPMSVGCQIVSDQLSMSWSYDSHRYSDEWIEKKASQYRKALGDLLQALANRSVKIKHSPLKTLNKKVENTAPLFCIHPVTGRTLSYQKLAGLLDGQVTVYGIDSASFNNLGWFDNNLPEMAQRYYDLIKQTQSKGPYRLLGWSLGGALSMEIAARLESDGDDVEFIGLIDTYVPGTEIAKDQWTAPEAQQKIRDSVRMLLPNVLPQQIDTVQDIIQQHPPREWMMHFERWLDKQALSTTDADNVRHALMAWTVEQNLRHICKGYHLPTIKTQAHCWWAGKPQARAAELQQGLQQHIAIKNAVTLEQHDHLSIVRDNELNQTITKLIKTQP